jgi:hypothetical protein
VEYKGKVRPATLAADADALMLRVWESDRAPSGEGSSSAGTNGHASDSA